VCCGVLRWVLLCVAGVCSSGSCSVLQGVTASRELTGKYASLQYETCVSVLQHVAVCVAVCCNASCSVCCRECVAVCVATCCRVLQPPESSLVRTRRCSMRNVFVCCSVLQCVLQCVALCVEVRCRECVAVHVAVCCSVLQSHGNLLMSTRRAAV